MKTKLIIALAVLLAAASIGEGLWIRTLRRTIAEDPKTVQITDQLTGWQLLQMAIIKTESEFDSTAIGRSNDIGVLQITPTYVKEVNRILDTAMYNHTDAFNVRRSLEMFNIYQNAKNSEHDIERAIYLHNPGGSAIGYEAKVLSNYRYLVRLEEIRETITKF